MHCYSSLLYLAPWNFASCKLCTDSITHTPKPLIQVWQATLALVKNAIYARKYGALSSTGSAQHDSNLSLVSEGRKSSRCYKHVHGLHEWRCMQITQAFVHWYIGKMLVHGSTHITDWWLISDLVSELFVEIRVCQPSHKRWTKEI